MLCRRPTAFILEDVTLFCEFLWEGVESIELNFLPSSVSTLECHSIRTVVNMPSTLDKGKGKAVELSPSTKLRDPRSALSPSTASSPSSSASDSDSDSEDSDSDDSDDEVTPEFLEALLDKAKENMEARVTAQRAEEANAASEDVLMLGEEKIDK